MKGLKYPLKKNPQLLNNILAKWKFSFETAFLAMCPYLATSRRPWQSVSTGIVQSVLWLQQQSAIHSPELHRFPMQTTSTTTNGSCLSLTRASEWPGRQLLETYVLHVCGQQSGSGRHGVLLELCVDMHTLARKQIPALGESAGGRKGSSSCRVSDCQLVRFQLQHTVSQAEREDFLRPLSCRRKATVYLVPCNLRIHDVVLSHRCPTS